MTYQAAVLADSPSFLWKFADTAGPTAADASPHGVTGTYAGTSTFSVGGCPSGNNAVTLNGSTAYVYSTSAGGVTAPDPFSCEIWFKVANGYTSGGILFGFQDAQTGQVATSSYDRLLYLSSVDTLEFGVYAGSNSVVSSTSTYNDGNWHHVVGTFSSGGTSQKLYVDGASVGTPLTPSSSVSYTGFWHVGASDDTGWPDTPSSLFLAGTVADAAIYPVALSAGQVATHYAAATYSPVYCKTFATQQAVKRASLW